MARKDNTPVKKRRVELRAIAKHWIDQEQEQEVDKSYASGSF